MDCLQTPTAQTVSVHVVGIVSSSPTKQGMYMWAEKEGEEEAGPVPGFGQRS